MSSLVNSVSRMNACVKSRCVPSKESPGIPEIEREAVTKRFYRSDKSRSTEGLGLGLSLVAAIAKLHAFQSAIEAGPGCTVEIVCPPAS